MDWITENVAVGNYMDALDADLLRKEAVRSILGLVGSLRGKYPVDTGVKEIEIVPLEDAPGNDRRLFRLAVDTLSRLVVESPPVLVHCHAGRSRSAVVVAAHLMQTLKIEAEAALATVAAKRQIAVTPGLERLLDLFDCKQ